MHNFEGTAAGVLPRSSNPVSLAVPLRPPRNDGGPYHAFALDACPHGLPFA